jgi:hypothetical protein
MGRFVLIYFRIPFICPSFDFRRVFIEVFKGSGGVIIDGQNSSIVGIDY